MKRYASFQKLKQAADSGQAPAAAQPQAEAKIIAFLQLVKKSVKPEKQAPATSDD